MTTAQNLREFFRQKRRSAKTKNIDWAARRDSWIKAVENLYKKIVQSYLAAPISEGSVTVGYREKAIFEEYIGEYQVRELVVRTGDEKVVFSPKAAVVVGGIGRLDLVGDFGEVSLLRKPWGRWFIIASRAPAVRVFPLNEESLLIALKSVMRQ